MPRVKRRGHVLRDQLTDAERWELLIGPGRESEWPDDSKRRAAYWRHRDELAGLLVPDGRGWAWIVYEGGGFKPGEGSILTTLARIDAQAPAMRREKAIKTNFERREIR